jgi:O-antigen/teichoic acid export membrane protein
MKIGRLRSVRPRALGAIAAQFSQAIASFLLQVLAYRYTGQTGLGVFALIFGLVVLATAITTGLVGDSLTVLDRSDPAIRSGLQRWLAAVVAILLVAFSVIPPITGRLGVGDSVLLAFAAAFFVIEDAFRRWLMALLRFGSLVVVDLTAAVSSIGFVVVSHAVRDGATITTFITGLLVGQVLATVVAVIVLPRGDRWVARAVRPDLRSVWSYGAIRGLQQMLRPGMMTLVRVAVIAIVSTAAYGRLEAARVYVAPATLMVSGAASFLFASYARARDRPLPALVRRADRAVVALMVVTALLGLAASITVGFFGKLIVGDDDPLSAMAVLGWSAYAAASAAVTPYGSLAAVRGKQGAVLAVRVAESVVSVVAVFVLVSVGAVVNTVPFVLALVSVASGAYLRLRTLPAVTAAAAERDAAPASA